MVTDCTGLHTVPHTLIVQPAHGDKRNAHKLHFITSLYHLFSHEKSWTAEINTWGRKDRSPSGPCVIPHIPIMLCSSIKLFHFEKLLKFCTQRPQTTIILLLAVTWYCKYSVLIVELGKSHMECILWNPLCFIIAEQPTKICIVAPE